MKRIFLILSTSILVAILCQCKEKISSPSTKFSYYMASDASRKINLDSIPNNDQIVFKADDYNGADYYTLYIGSYKIGTDVGTPLVKIKDSLVCRVTKDAIQEPGVYKVYMVATNVSTINGQIKTSVDSSKSLVVYDPIKSIAKISDFKISQGNAKIIRGAVSNTVQLLDKTKILFPFKSTITEDSIIYKEVNPKYLPVFKSVYFNYIATSDLIYINDSANVDTFTPLSIDTKKGNYVFQNGCKIKIVSKDKSATKIYSIGIYYIKL